MAEEKVESREITWRQLLPWTELFRSFQVALDLNKLLLAAAGIVVMALGWWLLSVGFAAGMERNIPDWPGTYQGDWARFRKDRLRWNLMHEAIALDPRPEEPLRYEVKDIAETDREYELFKDVGDGLGKGVRPQQAFLDRVAELEKGQKVGKEEVKITAEEARRYRAKAGQYARIGRIKPAGRLNISPWSEDRGPNPYLLVTGQAGIPWEPGYFWEWFTRDQAPVMVEPLVKFVRPIIYFLSPHNDFTTRLYFLLVTLFTLLTWSFFGGAITRIACVQLARGEKIGVIEAMRFTTRRLGSYILAPLAPLLFVFALLVFLFIFGLMHMIPVVGDTLVSGLFWPIPLVFGLIMAVALVGLVGWPLMAATISTEGTDSWEAVSRSYSYVYQRPWQYIGTSLVAIAYGGIVIFFVGFMGSLTVYLAKWGVNRGVFVESRDPSFLFVYAPTSFGWRELLLEGTVVRVPDDIKDESIRQYNGAQLVESRSNRPMTDISVGGVSRWNRINEGAYNAYLNTLSWWNKLGAILVALWLGLAFLLLLGFGYSFFWTASTIIYLLLRRNVDAAEMDEVYLEEEEYDSGFAAPAPAPAPAPAAPRPTQLPVVEAPRPASPPPAPTPAPAPAPAPTPTATTPAPAPATTNEENRERERPGNDLVSAKPEAPADGSSATSADKPTGSESPSA